ncbi:MAG: extracellular solute-binding protein [Candidatus Moraniibacteriota bacterium]
MRFFLNKRLSAAVLVVISGVVLSGCSLKSAPPQGYKVKLEVWGVVDDSDAYGEVFAQYKKFNPYVGEIIYRKLSADTYKADLLNALAAGNGPDVFMIRNAWRGAFQDKIVPMPDSAAAEKFYRDSFVDVAADDFIKDGQIYGAPLSVDSLGLYYNKDLFNAAGITGPPATWEDLLGDLNKLNRIDQLGNINQSAIALGTAYNINRSSDILTALMLQKGSAIGTANNGLISFSDENSREALEFYNQFSSVRSGNYSWNPRLHYSIDAFFEGTLGMMFNYSWRYAELQKKNAKLNFAVAPLPQFAGTTAPVNFANYWGFVVAKNKTIAADAQSPAEGASVDVVQRNTLRVHEAWQLIRYLAFPHTGNKMTLQNGLTKTTKTVDLAFDPTKKYLAQTKRPAARRDLIEEEKNDVILAPFATGNLIAKNWYQGNPEGVEAIFADMIDAVNKGEKSIDEALQAAASRVNVLSR